MLIRFTQPELPPWSSAICSMESCGHHIMASAVNSPPDPTWGLGFTTASITSTQEATPASLAPTPSATTSQTLCLFPPDSSEMLLTGHEMQLPQHCLERLLDKIKEGRETFDQWEGAICVYLSNCSQFCNLPTLICFLPSLAQFSFFSHSYHPGTAHWAHP